MVAHSADEGCRAAGYRQAGRGNRKPGGILRRSCRRPESACYAISRIILSSGVVLSLGVVVSLVSVVLVVLGPSISPIPSCMMLRGALKWWRRRAVIALLRIGVVWGVGLAAAVVVVAVLASLDGGSREVGLGTLWPRGYSGISGTYLTILFTAYIPPPVMIALLIKPMLDAGSLP